MPNWYEKKRPPFIPLNKDEKRRTLEQLIRLLDDPSVDMEVLPLVQIGASPGETQAIIRVRVKDAQG